MLYQGDYVWCFPVANINVEINKKRAVNDNHNGNVESLRKNLRDFVTLIILEIDDIDF